MLPHEATLWGALGYAAGSEALATLVQEYREWLDEARECEDKRVKDKSDNIMAAQESRVKAVK